MLIVNRKILLYDFLVYNIGIDSIFRKLSCKVFSVKKISERFHIFIGTYNKTMV